MQRRTGFWHKHPNVEETVRAAYASLKNPDSHAYTRVAEQLAKQYSVAVRSVQSYAKSLGLVTSLTWTKEEVKSLEALVRNGNYELAQIATALGRSEASVYAAVHKKLKVNVRDFRAGYTYGDVADCLGVARKTVRKWIEKGYLRKLPSGRIADEDLIAFLKMRPNEYSLKNVDEVWFKSMIFEGSASYDSRRESSSALKFFTASAAAD